MEQLDLIRQVARRVGGGSLGPLYAALDDVIVGAHLARCSFDADQVLAALEDGLRDVGRSEPVARVFATLLAGHVVRGSALLLAYDATGVDAGERFDGDGGLEDRTS